MTIRLLRFIAFPVSSAHHASVAVTFVALQTQHNDALVINLAAPADADSTDDAGSVRHADRHKPCLPR